MILQPFMSGISLSASVVLVVGISNGLSTWILDGSTLEEKVKSRMGGQ